MRIYGHFLSSPSNKVRMCANALELDYDYRHVDLPGGEQQRDEFLALNPRGKVPVLDDDGFILGESEAICRYLARKHERLYPCSDPALCSRVDYWMDVATQHILSNIGKVFFHRFIAPMLGEQANEATIEDGLTMLGLILPHVDAHLEGRNTFVTEDITLADISMLAAVDPCDRLGIDLDPWPHFKRWRSDMMTRPFYQQVHSHFGAEME